MPLFRLAYMQEIIYNENVNMDWMPLP